MKGNKLSVSGVILIISFLIYIVYLVSSNILLNYGMEFRESVIEFIAWDKFVFVIMLNILIIRIIMKRKKIGKEMKLFFTLYIFFYKCYYNVYFCFSTIYFNFKSGSFSI